MQPVSGAPQKPLAAESYGYNTYISEKVCVFLHSTLDSRSVYSVLSLISFLTQDSISSLHVHTITLQVERSFQAHVGMESSK